MDFIKVKSLEQARSYLEPIAPQWISTLKDTSFPSLEAIRLSTTACDAENVLNDFIQQQYAIAQKECTGILDQDIFYTCIECCVTAQLHDAVFGVLCAHLERHDNRIRECYYINDSSNSIAYAEVPLTAAVVELSNLDAHTSALEKLACLCTTHDLVYAEVKAALIELQAEDDSGTVDSGVVVVERDEVVALLAAVIGRSRPSHMYTNLYYVQVFGARLFDMPIPRQIYEDFSAAVEWLTSRNTSNNQETPIVRRHLGLSDIVDLTAIECTFDPGSSSTLQDNQRKRLLKLITTATTQHL